MNIRIVLLVTAGLLILTAIFLSLPTRYNIVVHNTRYFESCQRSSTNTQDQCETIEPPTIIEEREPYIVARWNKMQIDRQFTLEEVSTQWADDDRSISRDMGNGFLVLMRTLLSLLMLALVFLLPVYALVKAFKLEGSERIGWVCFIIFIPPVGSIIFLLARPDKTDK